VAAPVSTVRAFSATLYLILALRLQNIADSLKTENLRSVFMRRQNIQTGLLVGFCIWGLLYVRNATAEDAVSAVRRSSVVAEEQAAEARAQAERARTLAEQAEQQAAAAEARAARARRHAATTRLEDKAEQELAELNARQTERGLVLTLGDVLFAPDQAELTTEAMRKLYPLVTLLKEHPKRSIRIAGYTDSRGLESYNLDLSQRRADAVRDFLIENGVAPSRIVARGYGEAAPVASNTTSIGRRENRRVEVLVPREGARRYTRAR
jgi:OOP family OmpA-OmpF porin